MFIWWSFSVFLSTKAKVIVSVPMYDFTFAYLKMRWECLCPCDLAGSTSANSTFSVICFFPSLHISCSDFVFFQKCEFGGDKNWSYGIPLKTQLMSRYYVALLVQCWAVSCLKARATTFRWELHSQADLQMTIAGYEWSRYESAFTWWSEYVALTIFVIISRTCNAIKKICQTSCHDPK